MDAKIKRHLDQLFHFEYLINCISGSKSLIVALSYERLAGSWLGSVCFIKPVPDVKSGTLGVAHLITEEQFCDVVAQENRTTLEFIQSKGMPAIAIHCFLILY